MKILTLNFCAKIQSQYLVSFFTETKINFQPKLLFGEITFSQKLLFLTFFTITYLVKITFLAKIILLTNSTFLTIITFMIKITYLTKITFWL